MNTRMQSCEYEIMNHKRLMPKKNRNISSIISRDIQALTVDLIRSLKVSSTMVLMWALFVPPDCLVISVYWKYISRLLKSRYTNLRNNLNWSWYVKFP
jgi:hypothetical protein